MQTLKAHIFVVVWIVHCFDKNISCIFSKSSRSLIHFNVSTRKAFSMRVIKRFMYQSHVKELNTRRIFHIFIICFDVSMTSCYMRETFFLMSRFKFENIAV